MDWVQFSIQSRYYCTGQPAQMHTSTGDFETIKLKIRGVYVCGLVHVHVCVCVHM